jgi:hypothetical protein
LASWPHDRAETVRLSKAHAGQGDSSRIFLYVAPAQARGAWRAPGGWRLRVHQSFQQIEVEAAHDGRSLEVTSARLDGERIRISGNDFSFSGRVTAQRIVGELGSGTPLVFERAPYSTFPGFIRSCGSSARFTARISSISSAALWRRISSRFICPRPCSAEIDPPSAATTP